MRIRRAGLASVARRRAAAYENYGWTAFASAVDVQRSTTDVNRAPNLLQHGYRARLRSVRTWPLLSSASAKAMATTLATKPAKRRTSLQAPRSGMGVLSLQSQKQPRSNQGGGPNQKDHSRADRFRQRERRQDDHEATGHDQVSRASVRPDPARAVR